MTETENTEVVTENQEPANQEPKNQEDITSKLNEYEERLKSFADLERRAKKLEDDNKAALAEAARWQSSYKGLQRQTTQSLQSAAAERNRLAELERTQQELIGALGGGLTEVRESISALAQRMLDEDNAKEFSIAQRELAVKRNEELARQRAQQMYQQQPVQQQQPGYTYTDPEEDRRSVLQYYFPDTVVSHNDPDIDWAPNEQNQAEAMRRFVSSVRRLEQRAVQEPQANEPTESEKLLARFQQEREELERARQSLVEDTKNMARKEVEERARSMGVDVQPPSVRGVTAPNVQTRLEDIDERKMWTGDLTTRKRAMEEYQKQLDDYKLSLKEKYSI